MPELPPHFLLRSEELQLFKKEILDREQSVVITGKVQRIGLQGMGGIGKSVMAAALARDIQVQQAFPNGVFWIPLGQDPTLTTWQSSLARALTEEQPPFSEADQLLFGSVEQGKLLLKELLSEKACLLILDDVWQVEHAAAFDVLGPGSQLLITTRNTRLIIALGAVGHALGVLRDDQALALLAEWARQPSATLPVTAHEVMRECGNLPLALAMVGAMVQGKPNRWENVLHKLRNADLEKIQQQFSGYAYPDLLRAIQVSVAALRPEIQHRYLDFAVFPEDTPIPEAALQTFWSPDGLDQYGTQDVLDELVDRSLIRRDDAGNLNLHDLQFDYVYKQAADLPALHERLLSAYAAYAPEGWHTGPNDGYFFEQLAYHLLQAGWHEELQILLLDFDWLEAKLAATDIDRLIVDYDVYSLSAAHSHSVAVQKPTAALSPSHSLIQGALRLSAYILAKDKSQLQSQLYGRLLDQLAIPIQTMLQQIAQKNTVPWLRCLRPSLISPNKQSLRSKREHPDSNSSLAITLNHKDTSNLDDKSIKALNLSRGIVLQALQGHTAPIAAAAITPNGERAISISEHYTLNVWDLKTGEILHTLQGHVGEISAVAITPDSKQVVSGSSDTTLKVWDLDRGVEIRTLRGHSSRISAISITANCKQIISTSWDTSLKVWELNTGQVIATFTSDLSLDTCGIAPDGVTIVAGDASGQVHFLKLEGLWE